MTSEEIKVALDAQEARLRREFAREKPWWNDRMTAIKADPQTAGLVAILTAVATYFVSHYFGI